MEPPTKTTTTDLVSLDPPGTNGTPQPETVPTETITPDPTPPAPAQSELAKALEGFEKMNPQVLADRRAQLLEILPTLPRTFTAVDAREAMTPHPPPYWVHDRFSALLAKGVIVRVGNGRYRLANAVDPDAQPRAKAKPKAKPKAPSPPVLVPPPPPMDVPQDVVRIHVRRMLEEKAGELERKAEFIHEIARLFA